MYLFAVYFGARYFSSMSLQDKNKMSKRKKTQKAFSFIEVMISLFVLSVGFLGVIDLATTTLRNSLLQRDAVIASLLVQEGVELAYNVRDTNIAKGQSSFTGITAGTHRTSYSNPSFSACSTFADCQLSFVSVGANNFYGYGAGSADTTKFSRKIVVEGSGSDLTRTITSIVSWGGSFPSDPVTAATCNKSNQCDFTQSVLQE